MIYHEILMNNQDKLMSLSYKLKLFRNMIERIMGFWGSITNL